MDARGMSNEEVGTADLVGADRPPQPGLVDLGASASIQLHLPDRGCLTGFLYKMPGGWQDLLRSPNRGSGHIPDSSLALAPHSLSLVPSPECTDCGRPCSQC